MQKEVENKWSEKEQKQSFTLGWKETWPTTQKLIILRQRKSGPSEGSRARPFFSLASTSRFFSFHTIFLSLFSVAHLNKKKKTVY